MSDYRRTLVRVWRNHDESSGIGPGRTLMWRGMPPDASFEARRALSVPLLQLQRRRSELGRLMSRLGSEAVHKAESCPDVRKEKHLTCKPQTLDWEMLIAGWCTSNKLADQHYMIKITIVDFRSFFALVAVPFHAMVKYYFHFKIMATKTQQGIRNSQCVIPCLNREVSLKPVVTEILCRKKGI